MQIIKFFYASLSYKYTRFLTKNYRLSSLYNIIYLQIALALSGMLISPFKYPIFLLSTQLNCTLQKLRTFLYSNMEVKMKKHRYYLAFLHGFTIQIFYLHPRRIGTSVTLYQPMYGTKQIYHTQILYYFFSSC